MKIRLLIALGALGLAALAAAACSGDDDAKATPAPSASAAAAAPGQETAVKPSAPAGAGGGQVTGSGVDALKKLSTDLRGKTYQVVYDLSRPATGGSTAGTKGTVTISQKPPRTAFKIETPDAGGQLIVAINDGKDAYFCIKGTTPEGLCTKASGSGGLADLANFANVNEILKNLEGKSDVTEARGQTIAGREARCFDVKNSGGASGTATACFDKNDGLLLLSETTTGNEKVTLRATKVTTTVGDDTFALPYKVQDLPSIPGSVVPRPSATATR